MSFNKTFTRYCDGMKQPCPSPHQCAVDCDFNTAEVKPVRFPRDCGQGRLPITMYEPPETSVWFVIGWVVLTLGWLCAAIFYAMRLA